MQIVRIYYDKRWKMWKIQVAFDGHVYVLPLSIAVEFANKLSRLMLKLLVDETYT